MLKAVDFKVDESSLLHPLISLINKLRALLHGNNENVFSKEELRKYGPHSSSVIYLGFLGG